MSDRELNTRDLAGTSPADAPEEPDFEQTDQPSAGATDDGSPAAKPPQEHAAAEEEGAAAVDRRSDLDEPRSGGPSSDAQGPLLANDQSERFVTRWQEIQAGFVDKPRESVAEADALVADLMQRLAAGFSDERERLEGQWDRGDDVSTEDLRVALTRYRSFFDRLLSA